MSATSVTNDVLYPRQTISFSFCLYVDPAIAGGLNVGAGNGVTFDNIIEVSSSINGGTPTANVEILDFHTTETTVAANFWIPVTTPLVNFDGTYDFTNTVVITNDGPVATLPGVQYYMPMQAFVTAGLPFNTQQVTLVSDTGGGTVAANAAYDGTMAGQTGILAPGSILDFHGEPVLS